MELWIQELKVFGKKNVFEHLDFVETFGFYSGDGFIIRIGYYGIGKKLDFRLTVSKATSKVECIYKDLNNTQKVLDVLLESCARQVKEIENFEDSKLELL
jgi:hypothetical protein